MFALSYSLNFRIRVSMARTGSSLCLLLLLFVSFIRSIIPNLSSRRTSSSTALKSRFKSFARAYN